MCIVDKNANMLLLCICCRIFWSPNYTASCLWFLCDVVADEGGGWDV